MNEGHNLVNTQWNSGLAYGVGLIASDGYLARDTNRVGFISKELELIDSFQKALGISKPIGRRTRSTEKVKKYFYVEFKNKEFYSFLRAIGLMPAKSKIMGAIAIPDLFFSDFLRGIYDGDGTFWSTWDRRWPNSFVYYLEIASASRLFIDWLKEKLTILYAVKGHIKRGKGVYILRYVKGDTRRLFAVMYEKPGSLYLERKHQRIKVAVDFDQQIKQNTSTAAVAQW